MQCKVPEVNLSLSPDESRPLSIGFRMDNVTQLLRLVNTSLRYYGDPDFHQLNNILELGQGVRTNLTITVSMTAPSVCKIECVCEEPHLLFSLLGDWIHICLWSDKGVGWHGNSGVV